MRRTKKAEGIVRRPDFAGAGIAEEERAKMRELSDE
jgi:hypothetical protein